MTSREKTFLQAIGTSYQGVTPGFCLQAHLKGRLVLDLQVGQTWRYYDWASLTKIVFSATACMVAADQKMLRVSDEVRSYVPWFESSRRVEKTRVRNLLSHTAGLEWWRPYYLELVDQNNPWQHLQSLLERDLKGKRRTINGRATYSDLDLFVIGLILTHVYQKDLLGVWHSVNERLQLEDTGFHVGNRPRYSPSLYAPTENCPFRGHVLQGEVHDENTWALGGVAPHAGLFGPIADLSRWGLLLRASMRGQKHSSFVSSETAHKFTRRAIRRSQGDWALGFMLPTPGKASCGPEWSLQSVGHTGFVGTSLWYDPKVDLLVCILSNRVHPTRENNQFQQYRPFLHTQVLAALDL